MRAVLLILLRLVAVETAFIFYIHRSRVGLTGHIGGRVSHCYWKEREQSSYITRTRLAADVWVLDRDLFSDFDDFGAGRRINLDR